jgi:hypothetical protein
MWCFGGHFSGAGKIRQGFGIYFRGCGGRHTPGAKAPLLLSSARAKAKALGYLEATAEAKKQSTVEADPLRDDMQVDRAVAKAAADPLRDDNMKSQGNRDSSSGMAIRKAKAIVKAAADPRRPKQGVKAAADPRRPKQGVKAAADPRKAKARVKATADFLWG